MKYSRPPHAPKKPKSATVPAQTLHSLHSSDKSSVHTIIQHPVVFHVVVFLSNEPTKNTFTVWMDFNASDL